MSYIDPYELVFTNDQKGGIYTGGISVNSIMIGKGISPIRTLNGFNDEHTGGKVSDLFDNIVVPNWAFSNGIKRNSLIKEHHKHHSDEDSDSDSDNDSIVAGDLHDKLLGLIEETDSHVNNNNKNKNNNNKNATKTGGKSMKTKGKTRKVHSKTK